MTAEHIIPKFKVINLHYGLRREQEDDLRRVVQRQDGRLDVLVHPYYNDSVVDEYPASPEYVRQRDEFIEAAITTGQPLVIFQDEDGEIEAHTRDIQSGILYEVPGATPGHLEFWAAHHVGDILASVGVTHITVGGRILMYAYPKDLTGVDETRKVCTGKPHAMEWSNRDILPYGCPMRVACGFLQRGFDVSFSPIISPAVLNHD